jgi:excisionase family DNA binding protein
MSSTTERPTRRPSDYRPAALGPATYTVKEVSKLLSLSLGGTYALVREGVIPAKRMGGRWVIPKARFHAWLDGDDQGDAADAVPAVDRPPSPGRAA